jgi:PAS domain S-box-containing protein
MGERDDNTPSRELRARVRQSAERLERLLQTASVLSQATDPACTARLAVEQAAAAMQADAGAVWLTDGARLRAAWSFGAPAAAELALDAALPAAAAAREARVIEAATLGELGARYPAAVAAATTAGLRACVCAPLTTAGGVVGCLGLAFRAERALDDAERSFLETLARQCAQAMERAQLFDAEARARAEAERAQRRAAQLMRVTAELSRALTPTEVVDVIVAAIVGALDARSVAVAVVEPTELALLGAGGSPGAAGDWLARFSRGPLDATPRTPLADAARDGRLIWLPSRALATAAYPALDGARDAHAWGAAPLHFEGRRIGAIGFAFADPRALGDDDREFVLTMAGHCAQALERARLYTEAEAAHADADLHRRRLRAMIEQAPLPMLMQRGPAHVIELANPKWLELFPAAAPGAKFADAHRALAAAGVCAALDRVYATGETEELRELSLPGPLWFSATIAPARESDGVVSGVLIAGVDVTEQVHARHRIESEVAAREALAQEWRFLADAVPQIVWTAHADGAGDYFNRRWFEYTGAVPGAPEQPTHASLLHPDDIAASVDAWSRAVASGATHEIECRLRRADGQYRWHLTRAVPLRAPDGTVVKWFGTSTDVDDQRRAADRLRQLGGLIELARDAIIVRAPDDRVVAWNRGAADLYGYSADDALGRPLHELLATEYPVSFAETWRVLLHIGAWEGELVHRRRDGTRITVESRWSLERDPAGHPTVVLAINHDVTARKQADAERAALLEREQAARADAEAASRMKDEFLATLSHELRTPLNAILGWSSMLRAGHVEPTRRAHAADIIERNAKHQAQLIDDILDVSRIIAGKLRLELKVLALGPILAAAADVVRPAANAKEIQIAIDEQPTLASLVADPTRLQQVVWNLLSNAVKFTPRGGRVTVAAENDGDEVVLRVRDDGQGISPTFLPHVFERFRQADSSTTRPHGGLGLGLSIVRHLVELHGGTVAAASEGAGRGATFTVRLPRRPPGADDVPDAATARADVTVLRHVRVLVVDDEADARELIAEVLGAHGADVHTVSSVAAALAALPRFRPDVLVSDIAMSGEDGFELIRRVRALPADEGGRLPALALTAYAGGEDGRRVLDAGYQLHVAKPVEPQVLAQAVSRLVVPCEDAGRSEGSEEAADQPVS